MTSSLLAAVALMDELREDLGADSLRGEWETRNGVVSVVVPGPRVLVDGQEVPRQEPG